MRSFFMINRSVIIAFVIFPSASCVMSQEMSREEIACKLDPKCPKPGIRGLRGLSIVGDPIAEPPNSATFHINFDYDSAKLASDAIITLDQLAIALKSGGLTSFNFTIAGHTDAKGSDEYNLDLSSRRAKAVKDYLVDVRHISPERLITIGYGRKHLIAPDRPEDGVNRRVQVITRVEDGARQP